uniref:Uncharacterized protein n=1 Tax=Arundo donax TaxID=35708 RepID=A0A0A8XWM6_ARUDO
MYSQPGENIHLYKYIKLNERAYYKVVKAGIQERTNVMCLPVNFSISGVVASIFVRKR